MPGSSIGQIFKVSTFGESHGPYIGALIEGCPAGLKLNFDLLQLEMDRRKPGQSKITTQRKESDSIQIISGLVNKITTGAPICALIANEDQRSKDYDAFADVYRPSHADFTYEAKYGLRDVAGGGRSSARETAARVAAGAIAKQFLALQGIQIAGFVSKVGSIEYPASLEEMNFTNAANFQKFQKQIEKTPVRCPDAKVAEKMIKLIETVKSEGDTIGGIVSAIIQSASGILPVGLGEPVFDRLHADLGKSMLSINAAKGFEYGSGFAGVSLRGSEHNDTFVKSGKSVKTSTNHSGGIQGGISNGMNIYFRVAFKPVSTLMRSQQTLNKKLQAVEIKGRGRHDPCVLPRAVPIVEAMAALVLADHVLRNRAAKI